MVQKIFFSTTPNIFPKIILANSVYINAPNCHFTRTPNEYIIYFILDGKMILKEDTNIYNLKNNSNNNLKNSLINNSTTIQENKNYSKFSVIKIENLKTI